MVSQFRMTGKASKGSGPYLQSFADSFVQFLSMLCKFVKDCYSGFEHIGLNDGVDSGEKGVCEDEACEVVHIILMLDIGRCMK